MRLVQNPNKNIVENLNSVRREASRHFRNKKEEYLKAEVEELETKIKMKKKRDLYREISDFKKG